MNISEEITDPAILVAEPLPVQSSTSRGPEPASVMTAAPMVIEPQDCGCGGGSETAGYIYAIGNLFPIFPNASLEQEYSYAAREFKAEGPSNALFYQVFSQGQNLYIAEQMCWILQINGVDAYILKPRSSVELYYFIESLNPVYIVEKKFDVIVGTRGGLAPADKCRGLQLPMAVVNLTYYFSFTEFVTAMALTIDNIMPGSHIPKGVIVNMLQQILAMADNAGETDAHRAINYLAIRSSEIYIMAWQMQDPNSVAPYPPGVYFLQEINVQPSNVQGDRQIVDVIFRYQARDTVDIMYWYVKVDVTGMFPFIASRGLARYYPAP